MPEIEAPPTENARGVDAARAAALVEQQGEAGILLARRLRHRWMVLDVVANIAGAGVALTFLHAFHSAEDPGHGGTHALLRGVVELGAYLAVAIPLAVAWRQRRSRPMWQWLAGDRPPTRRERDFVLREPLRELAVPATVWAVGGLLFAAITLRQEPSEAAEGALTTILAGVTTCALIYLMIERLLRPATARALAAQPPEQPVGPAVTSRLITAWALASGVPLLGLTLLAVRALGGDFQDADSLALAVLVLTGAGLAAGLLASLLSAHSLADPIGVVRGALRRVHAGDLDVRVAVDDGSEIGLLQAGFNEMAAGLRERERLRDLFGRHVGEQIARRALDSGVTLGGEVREVCALFVDLVGSTALSSRRPPEEVVAQLNRFFTIVVETVEAHGGWVNKFEGDAALCVFGAPTEQADAAGQALASARGLRTRLRIELPELDVGIGLSAGPAVAGNVGSERRLEYTVIGDPVNEAARLCELAKRRQSRVLASGAILRRASASEAARWRFDGEAELRGRAAPTRLLIPIEDPSAGLQPRARGRSPWGGPR